MQDPRFIFSKVDKTNHRLEVSTEPLEPLYPETVDVSAIHFLNVLVLRVQGCVNRLVLRFLLDRIPRVYFTD